MESITVKRRARGPDGQVVLQNVTWRVNLDALAVIESDAVWTEERSKYSTAMYAFCLYLGCRHDTSFPMPSTFSMYDMHPVASGAEIFRWLTVEYGCAPRDLKDKAGEITVGLARARMEFYDGVEGNSLDGEEERAISTSE